MIYLRMFVPSLSNDMYLTSTVPQQSSRICHRGRGFPGTPSWRRSSGLMRAHSVVRILRRRRHYAHWKVSYRFLSVGCIL